MTAPEMPKTWPVEVIAKQLGVSARWLADECRAERVEHVHLGGKRSFTLEQARALVARSTVVPAAVAKREADKARVQRQRRSST
ncbi:hypothetical protein Lfu02_14700 [Longispora fulva]|uniref:Helix-turn-helix domain-containing protein n=1 Tax=Longispora fulva TaxID=619741 RepID=A0A8J7KJK8_9ACTN|nr:hypothetical protein [Longispora fulva]MBG6140520.1 hypothetical protein [Longispora fulva]GIG57098.1 hypothetical protein Lfu02_14700 [Longispora fulva]